MWDSSQPPLSSVTIIRTTVTIITTTTISLTTIHHNHHHLLNSISFTIITTTISVTSSPKPLTHAFNNNGSPIEDNYPNEQGRQSVSSDGDDIERRMDKLRQCRNKLYSKTLVFLSSVTRNLKKELSEECEGSISFHEFKGKKAKVIVRYIS